MRKITFFLTSTFFSLTILTNAQPISKKDSTTVVEEKEAEIPEVNLARWDKMYEYVYNKTVEIGSDNTPIKTVTTVSSEEKLTQERLRNMSRKSPFSFSYNNKVKAFIDMYLGRKRDLTERMLGLADFYYPEIEASLDKYGLPLELKHLVAVESAFLAKAKSRAGAVGLWQFMYGTGKIYGLKANSYLDDRMDPALATDAACRFLKDLYRMYGNWELALAAYNSGPGTVNKAIRYSGGHKNYWRIYRYLPRETRGYVPAFIAVNYIFEHYKELGVVPQPSEISKGIMTDTIHINHAWDLALASKDLNVSLDVLRFLNPRLKSNHIPDFGNKAYPLMVPYKSAVQFAENKKAIEAKAQVAKAKVAASAPTVAAKPKVEPYKGEVKGVHVVRKGENLILIAGLYNCSVNDLKSLNKLTTSRIDIGQKLDIPAGKTKIIASSVSKKLDTSKYKYHTVQPGDTLWDIANKYDGLTVTKIKQLNGISNVRNLKPGQKIAVGVIG